MEQFPTTAWTVIDAVKRDGDEDGFSPETNWFIAAYWKPVFRFLRSQGIRSAEAEDLSQAFFLRMLEKSWIVRADSDRGRFRTFLLTVLKRFVADHSPQRAPRQDGFEAQMVSVSALVTDEERSFEPPTGLTPDKLFMHEWARAVIAATCRQLRVWCENQGRPDWYAVFETTILPTSDYPKASQRQTSDRLGLSRDQVRTAQKSVKAQFIRLLRAEVAGQVRDPSDIDEEIRELEDYLQM